MENYKQYVKNLIYPLIEKIFLILSFILLILIILDLFFNNQFVLFYNILYFVLWILFTIEYSLKIIFSKHKIGYIIKNPFGLLIIIFPFLRPLGFLPISRFGLLFLLDLSKERLSWLHKYRIIEVILSTVIIIIISADLLLIFENAPGSNIKTFSDAVWFSVSTITTVGYGDMYPKTTAGRTLATILLIFGVAFFGALTAKVASLYIDNEVRKGIKMESEKIQNLTEEEKKVENLVTNVIKEEKKLEVAITDLHQKNKT